MECICRDEVYATHSLVTFFSFTIMWLCTREEEEKDAFMHVMVAEAAADLKLQPEQTKRSVEEDSDLEWEMKVVEWMIECDINALLKY